MTAQTTLSAVDAQCHEWAERARVSMVCCFAAMREPMVDVGRIYMADTHGVRHLADRIIALRMQQAAETAQGGAL